MILYDPLNKSTSVVSVYVVAIVPATALSTLTKEYVPAAPIGPEVVVPIPTARILVNSLPILSKLPVVNVDIPLNESIDVPAPIWLPTLFSKVYCISVGVIGDWTISSIVIKDFSFAFAIANWW